MSIHWESYGVDVDSAAFWDRYNTAAKNAETRDQSTELSNDDAEQVRAYCASFRKFYADLIGEDHAANLLKNIDDNKRHMDSVYESLLSFIYCQKLESKQRMARILMKYAPKVKQEEPHDTSTV